MRWHKRPGGTHGLWSVSRGLAARGLGGEGLKDVPEYKQHMAWADEPRQGDRDEQGNLSLKGLELFTSWFLRVCLDQLEYMDSLFDLQNTRGTPQALRPSSKLWQVRAATSGSRGSGEFEQGEASRIH